MKRVSKSVLLVACLTLAITGIPRMSVLLGPDVTLSATAQSLDKDKLTERMIELESIINDLKQRIAGSKEKSLQSEFDAAVAEYDAISRQMGGDRAPAKAASGKKASVKSMPLVNAPTGGIGVVPPTPVSCPTTITSATQSTPVFIPPGPAVVSSTVVVAGAGPSIWDVNLETFITHTFAADLDITLQSPAGTVVTLTSDNGAGNDNVFNPTVWDDQANPAGQVPYTTNNGLVTDHAYVNLVAATPLVPEEAMAAFRGEDPNGMWTITISDDLAGDSGNLDSWTLQIATIAVPTTNTMILGTVNGGAIPTGPAVVSSSLIIAQAPAAIYAVRLTTNISHTFSADLDVTLQSPAGTVVTLTTDNGAGNDDVFNGTIWDDKANPAGQVPYTSNNGVTTDHVFVNLTLASPLVPEEAMGAFMGEDINGTWTVTISDDLAGDGGTYSWTLEVTTFCGAACELTCPANVTVSNDADQCGAVVNYNPPTTTGTCGTVTCSPPSGSFFPVGTTTVNCSETVATCSFTVTVNDTQPPVITCPANLTVVADQTACAVAGGCVVANYTTPVPTDNCPGATVACDPPSGSCLPLGTTTVTCTATDASGNTATCSFTVTAFDVALQDDSDPSIVLLWNSTTGAYRFCCKGTTYVGVGKSTIQGCVFTLQHNPADRRVLGRVDKAVHAGNASIQAPPGTIRCTITDRNTLNDTPTCQ